MANSSFEIRRLPPELRGLIWEHSLPAPRLFHLKNVYQPNAITPELSQVYQKWFDIDDLSDFHPTEIGSFNFFVRHPPPAATQVCRESRSSARRAGFFVLPAVKTVSEDQELVRFGVAWFGGLTDILYHSLPVTGDFITGNTVTSYGGGNFNYITTWEGDRGIYLPNAQHVRNVGVEWRALLCEPPVRATGAEARNIVKNVWKSQILALYDYSPCLETIYLVLPTHATFWPDWDKEAEADHDKLNATLSPLALSKVISTVVYFPSWEEFPNGTEPNNWGRILEVLRGEVERAHDPQQMVLDFGDNVRYPPKISGLSLNSEGTPAGLDD
ncbi:hypothetical protein IMZ48_07260 [Candidatus Bathyarchaeota archaeon]|nr:hypothetical protein [Candidatus Bathyarchaeota archaeon]